MRHRWLVGITTCVWMLGCDGQLIGADDAGAGLDVFGDAPGLDAHVVTTAPDAFFPDVFGDAPGLDVYVPPTPDAFVGVDASEPCASGAACDDGNACTTDDRCDAGGTCIGAPLTCAGARPTCSAGSMVEVALDACDPFEGCVTASVACPPVSTALAVSDAYQVILRDWLASLTPADLDVPLDATITFEPSFLADDDALYATWLFTHNRGRTLPPTTGLRLPSGYFLLSNIDVDPPGTGTVMGVDRDPRLYQRGGRGGTHDPTITAWWAGWDYAGNPFRGSAAVKRRALVTATIDLMMTEERTRSAGCRDCRSDYTGGTLIWLAYAFRVGGDVMPPEVQAAYRTGLRRIVERTLGYPPNGSGGGDMEQFQHVSLPYAAEVLGDPSLVDRVRARSMEIFRRRLLPRSDDLSRGLYIDHGEGFDVAYEGISLFFLTWASLAHGDPNVRSVAAREQSLLAHLTLPMPQAYFGDTSLGGTWRREYVGPSHFSPATAVGAPGTIWYTNQVAAGLGMVGDDGVYLTWRGRNYASWYDSLTVPSVDAMRADLASYCQVGAGSYNWNDRAGDEERQIRGVFDRHVIDDVTMRRTCSTEADCLSARPECDRVLGYCVSTLPQWEETHWSETEFPMATEYLVPGTYARLRALDPGDGPNGGMDDAPTDPIGSPPFERSGDFVRRFGEGADVMLIAARVGGHGVVLHSGRLSTWGENPPDAASVLSGFGGGAISAFLGRGTGPVIVGMSNGYQNPISTDVWGTPATSPPAWHAWATHQIAGRTANGSFSSARVQIPTASATTSASSVSLTASGTISSTLDGGRSAPRTGATAPLAADMPYTRTFDLSSTGLRVRSEITLAGNVVTELVEALPIWLGESNTASATDTTIEVCTAASCGAGATWTPLGASWVASARAVRLSRFGASVRITLPSGGERVRMATPIWTVDYQTRGRARLLMIDLTRGGSPTGTVSVEYTIASE